MNPYDIWIGGIVTCLRDRFGVKVERGEVEAFVAEHKFRTGDSEERVARAYYRSLETPNWHLANSLATELRYTSREAALIIANFEAALRSALALMSPEQIDEFGEMDAVVSLRNARKGIDELFKPDRVEIPLSFYVPRNVDPDTAEELNEALMEAMRSAALEVLRRDTRFKGVAYVEE